MTVSTGRQGRLTISVLPSLAPLLRPPTAAAMAGLSLHHYLPNNERVLSRDQAGGWFGEA